MSPEQAAGLSDLDEHTDVYGLAVVTYEMLVGEVPGRWPTEEAVRTGRFLEAPAGHRARLTQVGPGLEAAMVRALAIRMEERTPTPQAFIQDLTGTALPRRRFSEGEVREIVKRASELEASAAGTALPPLRPDKWIGGPTRLLYERVVEGEVPEGEFPTLLEEIRRVLGIVGQVSQLGRSFSWSGTRGQRRDLEVAVSVRGGRTRVIAQANLANLIGGIFGGIGGGMGGGGMGPIAAIFGGGLGAPPVAMAVIIPLWLAATFATARSAYHYSARRRARDLEQLADRLAALASELAPQRHALRGQEPKLPG